MNATATLRTFEVNRKQAGLTRFQSPLTDAQAFDQCGQLRSEFAQSLAHKAKRFPPSAGQLAWAHFIACEALGLLQMPREAEFEADLGGAFELLRRASLHLQKPKVRLQTPAGQPVTLAWKVQRGQPIVYVGDGQYGGLRFGQIVDGFLRKGRDMTDEVERLLMDLADDPAGVAGRQGRLAGACCFCHLPLTDERSTAVGYGRVCARHYDLPWG